MAPPLRPPSLSTSHLHRRCSKAQMCFFNILHIISVFPAADVKENKCFVPDEKKIREEDKAFGDDVNLRLLPTEVEAANGFPKKSCVKALKTGSFAAEESEERATEHSEISHVEDQSSGIDYNGEVVYEEEEEEKHRRDEGYIGLLIEAVQLILGEEEESRRNPSKPPARRGGGAKSKRQCWTAATEAEWYAEFEDTSPVVKSKRGRSQVLPYKYRDSVVEPLVGSTHHHRSIGISAAGAAVPSKRRRSK